MERLLRVVEAGGRLLKVDRKGEVSPTVARAFLLTFDVGRLLIEVDAGKIHSVAIESEDELPSGLVTASEDEPWWRVMGCVVTGVAPGDVGAAGLRIKFREDDENPKFIKMVPDGAEVRISLE